MSAESGELSEISPRRGHHRRRGNTRSILPRKRSTNVQISSTGYVSLTTGLPQWKNEDLGTVLASVTGPTCSEFSLTFPVPIMPSTERSGPFQECVGSLVAIRGRLKKEDRFVFIQGYVVNISQKGSEFRFAVLMETGELRGVILADSISVTPLEDVGMVPPPQSLVTGVINSNGDKQVKLSLPSGEIKYAYHIYMEGVLKLTAIIDNVTGVNLEGAISLRSGNPTSVSSSLGTFSIPEREVIITRKMEPEQKITKCDKISKPIIKCGELDNLESDELFGVDLNYLACDQSAVVNLFNEPCSVIEVSRVCVSSCSKVYRTVEFIAPRDLPAGPATVFNLLGLLGSGLQKSTLQGQTCLIDFATDFQIEVKLHRISIPLKLDGDLFCVRPSLLRINPVWRKRDVTQKVFSIINNGNETRQLRIQAPRNTEAATMEGVNLEVKHCSHRPDFEFAIVEVFAPSGKSTVTISETRWTTIDPNQELEELVRLRGADDFVCDVKDGNISMTMYEMARSVADDHKNISLTQLLDEIQSEDCHIFERFRKISDFRNTKECVTAGLTQAKAWGSFAVKRAIDMLYQFEKQRIAAELVRSLT